MGICFSHHTYLGMLYWYDVGDKIHYPRNDRLSLNEIMVAFVFGAFAMATTNGGVGLFPILVSKALVIFGISEVSGDAFGWIMWIAQTLMNVCFWCNIFSSVTVIKQKQIVNTIAKILLCVN